MAKTNLIHYPSIAHRLHFLSCMKALYARSFLTRPGVLHIRRFLTTLPAFYRRHFLTRPGALHIRRFLTTLPTFYHRRFLPSGRFLRRIGRRRLEAVTVVELVLILVILIALLVIFKTQLINLVNSLFEKVTSESGTI